jgi:hypothetical protein
MTFSAVVEMPPFRKEVASSAIIAHLKLSGEQLDAEIAEALQLPLEQVRADMQQLSARGAVMTCLVTRYRAGKKIEGWTCRVAGFVPHGAPVNRPGFLGELRV